MDFEVRGVTVEGIILEDKVDEEVVQVCFGGEVGITDKAEMVSALVMDSLCVGVYTVPC